MNVYAIFAQPQNTEEVWEEPICLVQNKKKAEQLALSMAIENNAPYTVSEYNVLSDIGAHNMLCKLSGYIHLTVDYRKHKSDHEHDEYFIRGIEKVDDIPDEYVSGENANSTELTEWGVYHSSETREDAPYTINIIEVYYEAHSVNYFPTMDEILDNILPDITSEKDNNQK